MATIGDKKVSLALQDGSSINLNKPKVLPANITSFTQITEPGFYRGGLIYTREPHVGYSVDAQSYSDNEIAAQAQHPNLYINTNIPDFDDSEINFVITDGPDCNGKFGQTVPDDATNKYVFDLLVVPNKNYLDSPTYISKYKRDVMSYTFILFVAGYIYTSQLNKCTYYTTDDNADIIVDKNPSKTHNDEIPDGAVTKNGNVITASNWIEAGKSTISIINDLTSTDSKSALSAAQGKVLNDKITSLTKDDVGLDLVDNTPDEEKDVGNADTAQHLATKNSDGSITGLSVGNESTPVYFDPDGTPKEATNVMPKPIYSSTDLTPGVSNLANGQIYIVYYN